MSLIGIFFALTVFLSPQSSSYVKIQRHIVDDIRVHLEFTSIDIATDDLASLPGRHLIGGYSVGGWDGAHLIGLMPACAADEKVLRQDLEIQAANLDYVYLEIAVGDEGEVSTADLPGATRTVMNALWNVDLKGKPVRLQINCCFRLEQKIFVDETAATPTPHERMSDEDFLAIVRGTPSRSASPGGRLLRLGDTPPAKANGANSPR